MSRAKEYRVSFMPYDALQYDYVVEAKNEDEAGDLAYERLIMAIGRDASKDWECSNVEEINNECI
jgi:hypothetical protein|tara:strand:+ start:1225 stop:1419 length:195 start_codon:yes stop_codon:yes gene_type:complete